MANKTTVEKHNRTKLSSFVLDSIERKMNTQFQYKDHSAITREQFFEQHLSPKKLHPRGGVVHTFPEVLHIMLSYVEENDMDHIVSFQPHGRCFLVHKPKLFVEQVLPRFFRQTKLSSFQR